MEVTSINKNTTFPVDSGKKLAEDLHVFLHGLSMNAIECIRS
jgi:hypothetical protein